MADRGAPRALERAGAWVERRSTVLLLFLLLLYAVDVESYSLAFPLWHDELFTWHIAQAPTVGAMLHQTRTLDLNPPLSYLLTRLSFRMFGVHTLSCRLPEMLGFAVAMVAVFLFARRRAGAAYGLLAAALLLGGNGAVFSLQARPYGLLLGFTALGLLCWQRARDREEAGGVALVWEVALCLSLGALLLSHVFGLLAWASIVAGEAFASWQERRVPFRRGLALALPLFAVLTYLPLLRNHGASAFPPAFQPSLLVMSVYYGAEFGLLLIALLCAVALVAAVSRGTWLRGGAPAPWRPGEAVALGCLFAIPAVLIVHLRLHHGAWFDRYGVAAHLGFALLAALGVFWLTSGRRGTAFVALVLVVCFSGRLPDVARALSQKRFLQTTEPFIPPPNFEDLMAPGLPLVDASGLTFVEMNHRVGEPLIDRVYFLTDPDGSRDFAHATIFEGMADEARAFGFRSHVEPYQAFVRAHPRFYVFGTYSYPEDWLLRKLEADGLQLRRLHPVTADYKDLELYEVTRPPAL